MHKQILFSLLLITNTVIYGMKRERANSLLNNDLTMVLFHEDLIPQITAQLCKLHNYTPKGIRKDIRALSKVHSFFSAYYKKEKPQQNMIDLCIPHNKSNTRTTARDLGCHTIYDKVKRLTNIVRYNDRAFTEDDLQCPWYLNITTTYGYKFYNKLLNQSLLYIAIDNLHFDKAQTIIDHSTALHFDYGKNQNPLLKIVEICGWLEEGDPTIFQDDLNKMLALAHGLLKKGIFPDGRQENSQITPLMHAVKLCLKDLIHLLIEYDADPKLTGYDECSESTKNAFDFEWKKGWLQKIIDKATKNKRFRIAPSPTDQSAEQ